MENLKKLLILLIYFPKNLTKAKIKLNKLQMGDMVNTKASINKTKVFLSLNQKVKLNEVLKSSLIGLKISQDLIFCYVCNIWYNW